jgi:hypothetical protein
MSRQEVFGMVKRPCRAGGARAAANCHTFRGDGHYGLSADGVTLEHAQAITAHESPHNQALRPPLMKSRSIKLSGSELTFVRRG